MPRDGRLQIELPLAPEDGMPVTATFSYPKELVDNAGPPNLSRPISGKVGRHVRSGRQDEAGKKDGDDPRVTTNPG